MQRAPRPRAMDGSSAAVGLFELRAAQCLPGTMPLGTYTLNVVAMGIPSNSVTFTLKQGFVVRGALAH